MTLSSVRPAKNFNSPIDIVGIKCYPMLSSSERGAANHEVLLVLYEEHPGNFRARRRSMLTDKAYGFIPGEALQNLPVFFYPRIMNQ